jgi:hypothetical protein
MYIAANAYRTFFELRRSVMSIAPNAPDLSSSSVGAAYSFAGSSKNLFRHTFGTMNLSRRKSTTPTGLRQWVTIASCRASTGNARCNHEPT